SARFAKLELAAVTAGEVRNRRPSHLLRQAFQPTRANLKPQSRRRPLSSTRDRGCRVRSLSLTAARQPPARLTRPSTSKRSRRPGSNGCLLLLPAGLFLSALF